MIRLIFDNLFDFLTVEVNYALRKKSTQLMYEALGELKMARKMCAITDEQFKSLYKQLEKGLKMTNEELKAALYSGQPVVYDNPVLGYSVDFKCVSAIIYRVIDKKLSVTAEVTDKYRQSVMIVRPEYLRRE